MFDWLSKKFGRTRVLMAYGALGAAAFCGVLFFSGMLFSATAQAYVPERPTVELVRVFSCEQYDQYGSSKPEKCAADLENKVNAWLQEKQPGIRIVHRTITVNKNSVYLAVFYEVPEWRTQKPKPPAEAQR